MDKLASYSADKKEKALLSYLQALGAVLGDFRPPTRGAEKSP